MCGRSVSYDVVPPGRPEGQRHSWSPMSRRRVLSGNEAVVVWLALFAHQPFVGFRGICAREFLLVRTPLHGLLHADGNHAEMGDGDRTMSCFHGTDRVFAAAHRLEEIAHMVAAFVERDGVLRQGLL